MTRTIESLKIFDRIEVGPVKLEPDRVTVDYQITQGDRSVGTTYEVVYDEDVFDPEHPACLNLASMIAVQPVLNYGLFTKKIIFKGNYDNHDRRFIRRLDEVIARDIYCNHDITALFLWEAPAPLPQSIKASVFRSDLSFPPLRDTVLPEDSINDWSTSYRRHAVLMDRKIESLLSMELLEEMEMDVSPIFFHPLQISSEVAEQMEMKNLKGTRPSHRVRTNLDDLHSWVIHQLPLWKERPGSASGVINSLLSWKSNAKAFTALPLLRKHKMGRIVSSQTYGAAQKSYLQNLVHFQGSYEKSSCSDISLSRYFLQKGWEVNQFSLIRPLSTFLAARVLQERYPESYRLHLMCSFLDHHEVDPKPCGQCQSCLTEVCWLLCTDQLPTALGYPEESIDSALQALEYQSLKLSKDELRYIVILLKQRGLLKHLNYGSSGKKLPTYLLQPRFDREQSSLNAIPNHLRAGLYHIFQQHVDHSVIRVGRGWKAFDPCSHKHFSAQYPFELIIEHEMDFESKVSENESSKSVLWGELTWGEVQQRIDKMDLAILPIGVIAQHGPHLPLNTGTFFVQELAVQAALSCEPYAPLVLPTLPFGVASASSKLSGAACIQSETLTQLIYDVGVSLAENNVSKLLIMNWHKENIPAILQAAQKLSQDIGLFVCVDSSEASRDEMRLDPKDGMRTGEIDTSLSLYLQPNLVQMSRVQRYFPRLGKSHTVLTEKKLALYFSPSDSSATGLNDLTKASSEKGKVLWRKLLAHSIELIETLTSLSPTET